MARIERVDERLARKWASCRPRSTKGPQARTGPSFVRYTAVTLVAALAGACTASRRDQPPPRSIVATRLVCPAERGDCDGDPANGCETDLGSDAGNCRACGHVCRGPHVAVGVCLDGRCAALSCEEGFGDCDGSPDNGCEGRLCRHSHGVECAPRCTEDSTYEY